MHRKATITLSGLLLAVLALLFGPEVLRGPAESAAPTASSAASTAHVDATVGFTSERSLDEHYKKHGREFGTVTRAQYLRLAQELRDAPAGGAIREALRDDRVITRFDTRSGAFLAFHDDKSIRTFFVPNDGLRYFERQLDQEH